MTHPRHHFLPKLEISDRIQLKIAFVFMIIQVKAIDTTSGVTATGGLHSNFFMGIANIDSLPTATMILSISLSLPCPISRSQVFTLQSYDKRKPASTTWRLFLIFCLSSRWLPKKKYRNSLHHVYSYLSYLLARKKPITF